MDNDKTVRPVWYEAHPVTPERKAQIRALGFVILDAAFKPEGVENPDVPELAPVPCDENGLRLDGPTVAAFVDAGYPPGNYPPAGYASRSTAEEIAAAIAAHAAKGNPGGTDTNGDGKVSAAELKAALTAKGIEFKGNASKTDLQALLDANS